MNEVQRSVTMVLALLLGSFALAYGVGEASAQLSSREPRAALAHEQPTTSPAPATEPTPSVKPPPTATPRPKPSPKPSPSPARSPPARTPAATLLGPATTATGCATSRPG